MFYLADSFEVTLKKVHRIELPTIFGMRTVNSFLVVDETVSLIDCGEDTDASFQALNDGIERSGLRIGDIDQIIVTHAHVDHIGMASRISSAANAPVWVSELVYPWAVDPAGMWEKRRSALGPEIMKFFPISLREFLNENYFKMMDNMSNVWKAIDESSIEIFDSKGSLHIGASEWEVLYLPGHSQTQSAFYHPTTKEFFSADMLLKITPTPVIEADLENPSERTKGIIQLLESYHQLLQLNIDTVYPGHYEIFYNAHDVIQRQLKRIETRKQQCLTILQSGVTSFFELLQQMYSSNFHPPALIMLIGYLDLLESDNKIRLEEEEGVVQIIAI